MGGPSVVSFTTSQTLRPSIVSAVNRAGWGGLEVVSRYAARASTGRLCADMEPTESNPSVSVDSGEENP